MLFTNLSGKCQSKGVQEMRVSKCVRCKEFPCGDVKHECYIVPDINLKLNNISMVMISEAAPPDPRDYYYAKGEALFQQTNDQ